MNRLVQPVCSRAAGSAEVLAGGVEQDSQVLAADPAAGTAPGLAERGVELLAVGARLDLGEPAAPHVDPSGRAVEVAAEPRRDAQVGLVVQLGQRNPGILRRDNGSGSGIPAGVGRAAPEGVPSVLGRPPDGVGLAAADGATAPTSVSSASTR
ncbi:hypothetical protein O1L60_46600 [Streptomyces diastatochromogenes]|nr:hypothetical protein [Streptomyces diastatochromogenes]